MVPPCLYMPLLGATSSETWILTRDSASGNEGRNTPYADRLHVDLRFEYMYMLESRVLYRYDTLAVASTYLSDLS